MRPAEQHGEEAVLNFSVWGLLLPVFTICSYSHTVKVIWSHTKSSSSKSPIKYNLHNHLTAMKDTQVVYSTGHRILLQTFKDAYREDQTEELPPKLDKWHLFSVLQIFKSMHPEMDETWLLLPDKHNRIFSHISQTSSAKRKLKIPNSSALSEPRATLCWLWAMPIDSFLV